MSHLDGKDFCKEIACEEGFILKENMNRLALSCIEKTLEPFPNEITSAQIDTIEPKLKRCFQIQGKLTPIVSKEKMLLFIKDRDNYQSFSEYNPNLNRLELNNLVANCYQEASEELPPVITINQVNTVELYVQKCVFEHGNLTN